MLRYGPWNLLRREDVDLSAFYFLLRSHKASGKQAEGDHCLEADQGMGDVMPGDELKGSPQESRREAGGFREENAQLKNLAIPRG